MKYKTILLLILTTIATKTIVAQEVVAFNDHYINQELIYKNSDDSLFTGVSEKRRKNGHLVLKETFNNGVILEAKYYYNGKQKIVSDSIIYNSKKPYKFKELYRFSIKTKNVIEKNSYDETGKLIRIENYENNSLTYSCEYNGKKKHGKEFCYSKQGEPLQFVYINGKKVKG
jgi:antitoxin component YwqK of YwqJK toxin-antitoxin module